MEKKKINNNNLEKVSGGQEPQEAEWERQQYNIPEKDREGLMDPIGNKEGGNK